MPASPPAQCDTTSVRRRVRPSLLAVLCALAAGAANAQETPVVPGGAAAPRAASRQCDRSRLEMIDAHFADSLSRPPRANRYLERIGNATFFYFAPPEVREPRHASARAVALRDGSLATIALVDSSEHAYFNREVRHALDEASHARVFRPFPDGVTADSLPLTFFFGRRAGSERPYLGDRTVCPAWPSPRNPHPAYPAELRSANITGLVVAQFMVDTAGQVVPGTFVALSSTAPEFTRAVESVLDGLRFLPAEIQGRKVAQLTQEQFTFDLGERQVH